MATKEAFLDALSAHKQTLQGWLDEIDEKNRVNSRKVKDLDTQRRDRIDNYVETLLPNIEDSTLASLEKKLPNFMKASEIKKIASDEELVCSQLLSRITSDFNPANAANNRMTLETSLEGLKADLEIAESAVEKYESIPNFMGLLGRNYNTSNYAYGFFTAQYHTDWKNGDAVVAASGCSSWESLVARYTNAKYNADAIRKNERKTQSELDSLEKSSQSHSDVLERQKNIAQTVTEQVQVKLKAYLNTLHPMPAAFKDIIALDEQISALQSDKDGKTQDNRADISKQLMELQKIERSANNSRSNTVPDEYMKELKSKAKSSSKSGGYSGGRRSGSSGGSTQHIYVHDSNWMLDAIIFNSMMDHFDHSSSHHHDGSYQNNDQTNSYDRTDSQEYAAAENDSYGRSS